MLVEKSGVKRLLAVTAIVWWSAACTTATYSGPRRSADEVAVLVTSSDQTAIDDQRLSDLSTSVAKIDGKEVKGKGSSFELLPGRHSVEVTGLKRDVPGMPMAVASASAGLLVATAGVVASYANAKESRPIVACFIARPRHTYGVRTFRNAGSWKVEIIDQTTTYVVTSPCPPELSTQ